MRGRTLVLLAGLLVATAALPAAADLPPGGTFTDDDGNTHEGTIEALSAAGVTKGCNPPFNDRYCPDEEIDRGQIAAFLARALSLPPASQDYFVDDEGSIFEDDINAIAAAGITKGCNPPANDRYCPDDNVQRDAMASFLARAQGLTAEVPPPRPPLDWELVVDGLSSPIQAVAPPGEDRLLIAQQNGLVRIFENGSLQATPFLDIRSDVVFGGERGLLSIAIHPDYPTDRRMFAWYSGSGSRTYLVEYDIADDLQSASLPRTVLSVAQPYSNHNGGFVDFGPDGYLYLGLGDGGSGNDPGGRARNLSTLLGKMIRIDLDGSAPYEIPGDNPYVGASGRDEIWASGLRNPWRWSFDDGYMFIGDVGQGAREEINLVPVVPIGYDFGWSRYEGSLCNRNDPDPSCATGGLTFPVVEYGRSSGRSVTGGVVYRGPAVRSMTAYYVYADVFSGLVRGFRVKSGRPVEGRDLTGALRMSGIVAFGHDGDGELIAVNLFQGAVYRMVGG